MSKRRLSPALLPAAKRLHKGTSTSSEPVQNFDSILYDELVLVIFSYLSWADLCSVQVTNRNWARLATDNQLWKELFIREYGRSRLRGSRGFHAQRKHNDREVKPLPSRAKDEENVDWKWMFRISSNWRKGRCDIQTVAHGPSEGTHSSALPSCLALVGGLIASSSPLWSSSPPITLRNCDNTLVSLHGNHRTTVPTYITNLTLDQSPPPSQGHRESRLVAFYETGDFAMFLIDPSSPSSSRRMLTYHAAAKTDRTSPIIQAAYHHPLLVTLSSAFQLSLYDMADGDVKHTQTLTSFTSYPPSSLVLSAPSSNRHYRLVISYAVPVYPAHWSVAVTELTISTNGYSLSDATASCTVVGTRTARAVDIPAGWIDEEKVLEIRAQWNRKVGRVADTQTDGKWVVLAPSSSSVSLSPLQLYRLHFPKQHASHLGDTSLDAAIHTASSRNRLTFVRSLYGPTMPIRALALADGRCVSFSAGGEVWVWDLEHGWGVEVQSTAMNIPLSPSNILGDAENGDAQVDEAVHGAIVFDERRIVSADATGVSMRRFDM